MKKIPSGFILPSAAITISKSQIKFYQQIDKNPEMGDLVYGSVSYLGQHSTIENKQGRIHVINDGSRAVFVFGNRYAPDYYEGFVPDEFTSEVDVIARSGIVGRVRCKNANIKDPTRVTLHGYVCSSEGDILNTRSFNKIRPSKTTKSANRARMILVIGTAMNSGKSLAASSCCWALAAMGHPVRASKVTGTASLKDILLMEDCGAHPVVDFTRFGFPSTYLLDQAEILGIFNTLDLKYANNPKNYWVVEIADGLLQRETSFLLQAPDVKSRIHKLIFCSHDACGAIGGLSILRERYNLVPDAISGICSSSPLSVRELREYTDIPVFDNFYRDLAMLKDILI